MESPGGRPRRERWSSELPQEIIRSIAKLLENDQHDLLHFRMVCKNWRRSTALSALLPETPNDDDDPYLFSSTAYLLRPPATSFAAPSIVCSFETSKGNLQFRCPFSRTPLQNMPKHFNPEHFDFCRLAVSYHLVQKSEAAYYCEKVLVASTQLSQSINDCAVVGLHDGGQLGGYPPSAVENGEVPWVNTFSGLNIDDVVRFRGMILALDRQGCVYEIDNYTLNMARVFVNRGVFKSRPYKTGWRKRLVGTSAGQLYLVVRQNRRTKKPAKGTNKQLFNVYELSGYESDSDSPCSLHEWVEVEGFGDQVMFVFRDYSFFASADEFPRCQLRNCMVYSKDSFPLHLSFRWEYFDEAWGGIKNVGVFRLGPQRGNFLPASLYPNFPESLWSPPSWVLQHNPTQRIQYDTLVGSSNHEEEDGEPAESNTRDGASNHEEEDEATVQLDPNSQDNESHHEEVEVELPTMQVDSNNQVPPSTNGARHEVREDSQTYTKEETIHSVTRAYITSSSTSDTSTVQFKGFNISSTLVPTLQNIWSKHGDIVGNSIIRNGEILARALESLANMVRILKDSTNGSLNDSLADYLNTTLSDLQNMHFEVDWLVPFVKKASDYHKSKPLVDSLKELGDAKAKTRELRSKLGNDLAKVDEMEREVKARAAEMRSELDQKLAELDEVEKELEQDITVLSETIPFSGELNFDELL